MFIVIAVVLGILFAVNLSNYTTGKSILSFFLDLFVQPQEKQEQLNYNVSLAWIKNISEVGEINYAPTIASLNKNSTKQYIFVGTSDFPAQIHVFDIDGNYLSGWPTIIIDGFGEPSSPITITDLDNDGYIELSIIIYNQLYLYRSTIPASAFTWPMAQLDSKHTGSYSLPNPFEVPAQPWY
ncbi:MAG: hypothetical protein QXP53_00530 [Candidatus Pacearchaeota archaeon]